jgi:hypothetical protein
MRVSDEYERRLKRYQKKRPRETKFVHDKFDSFMAALNAGARPEDVQTGFVHPEPGGVLAITEKGAGRNAIPLRLYIYPDNTNHIMYVITLGDKQSQSDDLLFCKNSLKAFLPEGPTHDVQGKDLP